MSGVKVNVLKDRARFMLQLAREALSRGRTGIAAFLAEQAVQLRLKAALLRLGGEAPTLYSIRELLGILARLLEVLGLASLSDHVREFTRRFRDTLVDLEDAYTEARYAVYTEPLERVEEMIAVVEKLFSLLDEVEERALG